MGKKILIIDDEADILVTTSSRLRANQYEVVTAGNGDEGLAKAAQEKPDLILLDLLMPGTDGYSVLGRLKESEGTKDIPIIAVTVKFQREDVEEALRLGASDCIVKPFKPQAFLEKIEKILSADSAE